MEKTIALKSIATKTITLPEQVASRVDVARMIVDIVGQETRVDRRVLRSSTCVQSLFLYKLQVK